MQNKISSRKDGDIFNGFGIAGLTKAYSFRQPKKRKSSDIREKI